ncbi:proteinase-activated receptor 4 isoform X2 [Pelodiscus sinensis]|uniref:proteinase-activated receptor 4 isoform X2 n=1 Tax=Pelodiscus sinensis TaxID=13735 RepID=UPI003F6D0DB9
MERSWCTFVLWCSLWGLCLASPDYDDYSQNNTSEQEMTSANTLCPRAIPGETVTRNNITYLSIHEASRSQLSSAVTVWFIPCLYTAVFLVGLPANGLALWVLATRIEKLTSTIFLMNLAAADLLLVLVLPFKITYYFLGNHWPFGEGLCRLTTAFFYGNMYCSVLLLMCISVDRYLAAVHPFFSRSFRSPGFAACTCLSIWLIAAIFTLPLTLLQQSYPLDHADITLCHDVLPRHEEADYYYYYFVCLIACGFLAPLVVMLFSHCSVLWILLRSRESNCSKLYGDLYVSYMISLAFSSINSCVDPFVYYYVSEDFRDKVRQRIFSQSKQVITSLKTSKETLPRKSSHSQSLV